MRMPCSPFPHQPVSPIHVPVSSTVALQCLLQSVDGEELISAGLVTKCRPLFSAVARQFNGDADLPSKCWFLYGVFYSGC